MLVVYIVLGISSGLIAAIIALLSGAGILASLIAYLIAGTIGVFMGVLWLIVKQIYCGENTAGTKSLDAQRT